MTYKIYNSQHWSKTSMMTSNATAIAANQSFYQAQEITLDYACDLLGESEITSTVDLGAAVIHIIHHPTFGQIFLTNAGDRSAMLRI